MVMEELDRALTMFPGDKMYDYLTKNDVGMSDAKTAVTMFKGMVKDSKVKKLKISSIIDLELSKYNKIILI